MTDRRTLVLAAVLVIALVAVPLSASGTAPASHAATTADAPSPAQADDDREEEPTTDGTVGYVEGYWYDDELPVDGTERAALSEAELEAVVYRSMARVEVLRELTFEDDVDVDVISREAFADEREDLFVGVGDEEHFVRNVEYEARFIVDRETDAIEEYEALYSGSVGGYYNPAEEQVVLVSDSPDEPEVDEVILGHELLHALQDQHFDLQRYEKPTHDQANAKDGLIEGDAVRVERAYEERCESEWECVLPTGSGNGASSLDSFNTGLFFGVYQPYSDGPGYVDHLRDEGGWDAVDAAYDEPPASSAEVIRPGDDREPAEIDHEDRSSDRWEPLEIRGGHERVGEAGMAATFMQQALDADESGVLEAEDVYTGERPGPYEYDHEVTDGWAGDELVVYATENETIAESAVVWESEWLDADHAEAFLAGYRALLEGHGAEAVDDRADTYVIDDESFPGAYALEADDESVTIVRAPTVDELSEVREGSGEPGEDAIDTGEAGSGDGGDEDGGGGDDEASDASSGTADRLPGFGLVAVGAAVAIAVAIALMTRRHYRS